MPTFMRFIKLAILVPACSLSMAAFSTTASEFLSDNEAQVLHSHEDTYGLVLSKSEWVEHSETAATIVRAFEANGREILVVERNGMEALVVDDDILKLFVDEQNLTVMLMEDPSALLELTDGVSTEGLVLFAETGKTPPPTVMPKVPPKTHEGGFCSRNCWSMALAGAGKGALGGGVAGATIGGAIAGPQGAGVGAVGGAALGGAAGGVEGLHTCEKDKAEVCNK